jgi:WD40 repeat protein
MKHLLGSRFHVAVFSSGPSGRLRLACAAVLALATVCFAPADARSEEAAAKKGDASVGSGPWITCVRWVDDEHLVASEAQGLLLRPGRVVRAAAADASQLTGLGEQESSVWSVLPVGDGRVLASNYKGEVFLHGGEQPEKLEVTARWIRTLRAAPGGKEVLAGTEDGKLVVLSLDERKETKRIDAHAAAIFDIAVHPAGDRLATVAGDGTIKLFSWPQLEETGSMSRGKDAIWSVVFSNDGSQLITGGADRRIRLWDVAAGKFLLNLTTTSDWVSSLAAVPESSLVAAGCMNGQVVLVDYVALLPVTEIAGPGSGIWSVALSPNAQRLAVSTRKHGIGLIEASAWQAAAQATAQRAADERPPSP